MRWLVVGMVVVVACFVALAVTGRPAENGGPNPARRVVVAVWLAVVVAGWLAFAYTAVASPGGLDAAWEWVRGQSTIAQVAMWLLLLPYLIGLWLSQTSLAPWLRVALIVGLAVGTVVLSAQSGGVGKARGRAKGAVAS